MSAVKFREEQRRIIEGYEGGMMGISAVPGSGKTFTLSHLAARLVEKLAAQGADEQEVLIVTFSNSAVNSFKKRIADILQRERGLLPYVGYRVRTLHGLAHDIVRERPSLVGLSDDFQILDERAASSILREVVFTHLSAWGSLIDYYIKPDLDQNQVWRVRNQLFPELFVDVTQRFIGAAKDKQITPSQVQHKLDGVDDPIYDLLRFATVVYADYQRALAARGAVDFADLLRLALQSLQMDEDYLRRLQNRWVYVLEDEAQDSSWLQEQMLRLLAGGRNWVRVGDPNQAIYTTFTSADLSYLVNFLREDGVRSFELPTSGRSAQPIIDVANELVRWACDEHPVPELRGAFYRQMIRPTLEGDPQPNPPADAEARVYFHYRDGQVITPDAELKFVADSLERWLSLNPGRTVACLVPENSRGVKLAEELRARSIPYEELLRSTTSVRDAVGRLCVLLEYLASPFEMRLLVNLYRDVWWNLVDHAGFLVDLEGACQVLAKQSYLEGLLFPSDAGVFFFGEVDPALVADLLEFFAFVRFCLGALLLPVDQLVLTVAQRMFSVASEVALAYRVASLFRCYSALNPSWQLADFLGELRLIVKNQRSFLGFDDVLEGYMPMAGVVTIATMHAAKGLEWDRVYLLAVNNFGFPSGAVSDPFASEQWYLRPGLSLVDELLAQLDGVLSYVAYYEGVASCSVRFAFAAERLRLLYVALTRARASVALSWNSGWSSFVSLSPSVPFLYLWSRFS